MPFRMHWQGTLIVHSFGCFSFAWAVEIYWALPRLVVAKRLVRTCKVAQHRAESERVSRVDGFDDSNNCLFTWFWLLAAFLIPVLELLYRRRWSPDDGLGALIISPTRELAVQIFEVRCADTKVVPVRTATVAWLGLNCC